MPKRLSYGEVKEMVEAAGYTLISKEYINSTVPITVQCSNGHDPYKVKYGNFYTGKRCPTCGTQARNDSKRVKPEQVKQLVESEGYTLHSIKEGSKSQHKRLVIACPFEHEPYEVSYQNFKSGRRCPECKSVKRRVPLEMVRHKIAAEGFKFIEGEYVSNKSKLVIECPKGHSYPTTYDLFSSGKRCPKCNMSKGEILVGKVLSDLVESYPVTSQEPVRIEGTIYRYDFCIHATEKLYIEYDGQQHFKPVEAFGGEEGLRKQKVADMRKDEYAGDNLLRLPYYYSPEKIKNSIADFLKEKGL